MKKYTIYLILSLIALLTISSCCKDETINLYSTQVKYQGDSVKYDLNEIPFVFNFPPQYNDYYTVINVYTDGTYTIDCTHVLDNNSSVTYRLFVRGTSPNYTIWGWYARRIVTGFVKPVHRIVVIHRTGPYINEDML